MKRTKRAIVIITSIIVVMLIIPLITVNTVKADAGMLVTMLLFFAVNPVLSVAMGILSGKDIKFFWFTPLLVAGLFWAFSSFTYETAFPIVYSGIYFIICTIAMLITWVITKNKSNLKHRLWGTLRKEGAPKGGSCIKIK